MRIFLLTINLFQLFFYLGMPFHVGGNERTIYHYRLTLSFCKVKSKRGQGRRQSFSAHRRGHLGMHQRDILFIHNGITAAPFLPRYGWVHPKMSSLRGVRHERQSNLFSIAMRLRQPPARNANAIGFVFDWATIWDAPVFTGYYKNAHFSLTLRKIYHHEQERKSAGCHERRYRQYRHRADAQ